MNASVKQNEITGTTEQGTLTLVPMAKVNEKTKKRKMKHMKRWHKLSTLEKNSLSLRYSEEMLHNYTRFPNNCFCDNSRTSSYTKHTQKEIESSSTFHSC